MTGPHCWSTLREGSGFLKAGTVTVPGDRIVTVEKLTPRRPGGTLPALCGRPGGPQVVAFPGTPGPNGGERAAAALGDPIIIVMEDVAREHGQRLDRAAAGPAAAWERGEAPVDVPPATVAAPASGSPPSPPCEARELLSLATLLQKLRDRRFSARLSSWAISTISLRSHQGSITWWSG